MAPSCGSGGMVSERLKLKRKAVDGSEIQSKKAKMIPTPDTGSLDEGSDYVGSDNGSDEAQLEKSDTLELLTPRTLSMPPTPKPKPESETKKFPCTYLDCPKSFNRPAKLADHMRSHSNDRPFKCTYDGCDKSFKRRTSLKDHIQCLHTHVRDHACQWEGCDKRFRTSTKLKIHIAIHEGQERFRLPASGDEGETTEPRELGFHTYELFEQHKRLVHPPNCALCPKVCSTQGELRRHIEAQHSDTRTEKPRAYRCRVIGCCREFTKRSNLKAHIRSVHEHIRSFICGETDLTNSRIAEGWAGQGACGRGFVAKRALEEHVRIQHMGLETCRNRKIKDNKKNGDVSGELAMGTSMIERLTGTGYEESRHIPCLYSSCSSRFFRQYDLEIHMKTGHGLSDGETIELFVEKEALSGGRFWFGADVPDEEYWDHVPEDIAAFDLDPIGEGDAEVSQRTGKDKRRTDTDTGNQDSDLQGMIGGNTVAAFQDKDTVIYDHPTEYRGSEWDCEMPIDPVLRSL
ncbi:hypothetical protein GP486_001613 [Trichoglossum hirsutum]|uniref:C2H2-type domain-containing protein n=1 Tax=Trichoglossum hirsutum TaxID=265104 RepID=A0A9P8LGQ7_9PEZI|nr:hypothetical protein GP486_001613 [Trichoglossum hirsutum]